MAEKARKRSLRAKARELANKRRSREKGAEGSFTREEWLELVEQYDSRCAYCGRRTALTVDHVVPLSKGGSNYIENIKPACFSCNCRKNDMDPEIFSGAQKGLGRE